SRLGSRSLKRSSFATFPAESLYVSATAVEPNHFTATTETGPSGRTPVTCAPTVRSSRVATALDLIGSSLSMSRNEHQAASARISIGIGADRCHRPRTARRASTISEKVAREKRQLDGFSGVLLTRRARRPACSRTPARIRARQRNPSRKDSGSVLESHGLFREGLRPRLKGC